MNKAKKQFKEVSSIRKSYQFSLEREEEAKRETAEALTKRMPKTLEEILHFTQHPNFDQHCPTTRAAMQDIQNAAFALFERTYLLSK